jgi:hypothetical protein
LEAGARPSGPPILDPERRNNGHRKRDRLQAELCTRCGLDAGLQALRLPAVGTLKRYSKALENEYRVKTAALGTLKRYSILSLTLYLEWYNAYSIFYSGGPTS